MSHRSGTMRFVRPMVFAAASLLTLAGCGGDAEGESPPETKTVTVNFHLADFDTAFLGCEGTGGYSDIGSGTSVTVRDGEGNILGVGKLGTGEASSNGRQMAFCDWSVQVPDVPAGEKFYTVEVGSRGQVTSSEADLEAENWTVGVSLGE